MAAPGGGGVEDVGVARFGVTGETKGVHQAFPDRLAVKITVIG